MSPSQTQYVTATQLSHALEDFGENLAKRIVDDITDVFKAYVGLINERFTALEQHFDRLEARFDVLENRFGVLEQRFDGLEQRFNRQEHRLDTLGAKTDKLQRTLEGALIRLSDVEQNDNVQAAQLRRLETKTL